MDPTLTDTCLRPAYRHLFHRMRDPDEFAVAVSGASLRADFLGRQQRETIVEQFQTPDWAIDFQQAHVRARILGFPPPGWASMAVIRGEGESAWYGAEVRRGYLVCTPPGEPIDGWIQPGFVCSSIGVAPQVWDRCRIRSGADRDRLAPRAIAVSGKGFDSIEARLLDLRTRLASAKSAAEAELAAREARDFAEEMLTMAWELASPAPARPVSARNRARLARRAEDWLHAHHGVAGSVGELAIAMGASRREIEYSFRENFGLSPRQLLEKIRLNAIRRELRETGASSRGQVTRIAMDHGITHLGRFPALYRQLFGELPSETATEAARR